MSDDISRELDSIADKFVKGRMIPFCGAGVNMFGRTDRSSFEVGKSLPDGRSLSNYLAGKCDYPADDKDNLLHVSQYFQSTRDERDLYDELHQLFDNDFPVTALHQFFAALPKLLAAKGCKNCYQLLITTNYDDLLERAFLAAGEPFDLVIYRAMKTSQLFIHCPSSGEPKEIRDPMNYNELTGADRTVIMKIHGTVARSSSFKDCYVITEDNYINYLSHTDIANLIPVRLRERMEESSFLFLGYSLRDWNLRVILNRIWREQELTTRSWAVQLDPDPIEKTLWEKRNVKIINLALEEFMVEMEKRLK